MPAPPPPPPCPAVAPGAPLPPAVVVLSAPPDPALPPPSPPAAKVGTTPTTSEAETIAPTSAVLPSKLRRRAFGSEVVLVGNFFQPADPTALPNKDVSAPIGGHAGRADQPAAVQARPVRGDRYRRAHSRAIRQMSYFVAGQAANVDTPCAAAGWSRRGRSASNVPLATGLERFLAANTGCNDRFVQFLACDRLVQDTKSAGGGVLDA
jgi:hypothetical protein